MHAALAQTSDEPVPIIGWLATNYETGEDNARMLIAVDAQQACLLTCTQCLQLTKMLPLRPHPTLPRHHRLTKMRPLWFHPIMPSLTSYQSRKRLTSTLAMHQTSVPLGNLATCRECSVNAWELSLREVIKPNALKRWGVRVMMTGRRVTRRPSLSLSFSKSYALNLVEEHVVQHDSEDKELKDGDAPFVLAFLLVLLQPSLE